VNAASFLETVRAYNAAVMDEVPFRHTVKDGKGTRGIVPAKSNWAQKLDTPPYEAYATTCGITFTFGGVRIDHPRGLAFLQRSLQACGRDHQLIVASDCWRRASLRAADDRAASGHRLHPVGVDIICVRRHSAGDWCRQNRH